MLRRSFLAASGGSLLSAGLDPERLPQRVYYQQTSLTAQTAEIAAPPGYKEVAERLSLRLRPLCGSIPVRIIDASSRDFPAAPRNLILIGNAIDNPLIYRLYINHYTLADEYFPGRGGVLAHSVHNPFGDGRNAIVLGASDPLGAARAADLLAEAVRTGGPEVGFFLHSRSDRMRYDTPPAKDFAYGLKQRKEQVEKGDLPWPGTDYGMLYYLTGQHEWAELFRDLHLHAVAFAKSTGTWPQTVYANKHGIGYFYLYRVVTAWDLIEESPVFSDQDRRDITLLFLQVARFVAGLPYFRGELKLGNNHQTYAALSCYMSHRYFSKYYGIQEFEPQQARIGKIFAMHKRSWRPNDNEESTSARTRRHLMNYSLLHDDYEYVQSGRLRKTADWIITVTDNRADTMAFGDSGEYDGCYRGGPHRVQSARQLAILSMAASLNCDGHYAWARDWFRKNLDWKDRIDWDQLLSKRLGWQQRYGIKEWEFYIPMLFREVKPEMPRHLFGVQAAQLDEAGLEQAKATQYPAAEVFDKLTFRSSFDPKDEYLALEGCTTLPHSHDDANCIMRLTWRDRLWVVEGDEIKRLRRYHNGVVVVRNGRHDVPPRIARLKARSDTVDWGFTQTLLTGDNGLDWERNIFWRKGRYFVVWDRLQADQDGDYSVECLWRTLGNVKLDGGALAIEQDGEHFSITGIGEFASQLSFRECLYQRDREAYATYEHSKNGYMRVLRQSNRKRMVRGESIEFINLLQPVTDGPSYKAGRQGSYLSIYGPNRAAVGIAPVATPMGDLSIRASLFAIDGEGVHLANGLEVSRGGTKVWSSAVPVNESLRVSEPPKFLEARLAGGSSSAPPLHPPGRKFAVKPSWTVTSGANVFAAVTHESGLITGDVEGGLTWLTPEGAVTRRITATAGVSSLLRLADGSVVVGCRDASLSLVTPSGTVVWRKEFGPGIRQRMRVPSALLRLNDDIIVGMEDQSLFRFDKFGHPVWDTQVQYHSITNLGLIRVKNTPRLIVGTEYFAMNLCDERGEQLWLKQLGPVTAQAVADLDGDGDDEIVYAEWMGLHALRASDATVIWSVNLGGETLSPIPLKTAEGAADVLAASDVGQIARLDGRGHPRWHLDAGEPLTSIALREGVVAAGCLSGAVQLRNVDDGVLHGQVELESAVLKLQAAEGNVPGFYGTTERGTVFQFRAT